MKRKKTRRYISGMLVAVLLFLLCVVQNVNAEDVPAGSELPRLVDDADILTDSEEKELNQQLDTVSEEQECDVIIVTVDSLNGKTVEEYADESLPLENEEELMAIGEHIPDIRTEEIDTIKKYQKKIRKKITGISKSLENCRMNLSELIRDMASRKEYADDYFKKTFDSLRSQTGNPQNLKQQFDDIVESNEVVERAKERASQIINKAESYAVEIREGSLQYAEDVISCVEQNLIETLEIVKRNKEELREG